MKLENTSFHLKTIHVFIVILALGTQCFQLSAQNTKMIRKADSQFRFSEFNNALPRYLTLLKEDPSNFMYNYRVGMCYLNSNIETNKCVAYFEKAQSLIKSPSDSTAGFYYYLGHSYQITNQFDKALHYLQLSKSMLNTKKDSTNIYFINIEIEQCKNGKKAIASPTNARLFNLGKNINTIYPDYSPVVLADKSLLIFTSTRLGSTGGKHTDQGEFFEDIYVSKNVWNDSANSDVIESSYYQPNFTKVNFAEAVNAGDLVNTRSHDASIAVAPNGKNLFMYRQNAVWHIEIENGTLGRPIRFYYVVDGKKRYESSITITPDLKTLYFVSEQKGGIGGKDIYRSFKQVDGTWGAAENLGPIVNTEFDEEAPFFDSNEGVLYFSSQGHNSIGGFDVFKTKFDNDVWSSPKNLGYPVNSGTDDVFYSIDSKENKGFISTMREDGIGNYDIYGIRYLKPLKVLFNPTFSNALNPIDAKAIANGLKNNESLRIALNRTNDILYNSMEKYKLTVPHYDNTNITDVFEFETPESYGDFPYYQEINYEALKNHRGQIIGYKTTLYNGFFDIEKELQKKKDRVPNLKKEDEYAAFVKNLKSENQYFQILSKTNYLDTTMFAIEAEELAARALAGTPPATLASVSGKKGKSKTESVEKGTAKNTEAKVVTTKETVASKEAAVVSKDRTAAPKAISNSTAYKTILFNFSSRKITKEGKADVESIFTYLDANKDVKMEIIGYTDSKGSSKFNKELSTKRAVEIKLTLVKMGIDKKRLKAKGFGENNPVAPNKNEDGTDNHENRKLNRRVEFVIVDGK